MVKEHGPGDVRIGKFDILAIYTYAKALLDGLEDDEAGERGMVAAVMGPGPARASRRLSPGRLQVRHGGRREEEKATITAESYDEQVGGKMGIFFETTFLPAMKGLVEAHLSYEDVKRLLRSRRPGRIQDHRGAVPGAGCKVPFP